MVFHLITFEILNLCKWKAEFRSNFEKFDVTKILCIKKKKIITKIKRKLRNKAYRQKNSFERKKAEFAVKESEKKEWKYIKSVYNNSTVWMKWNEWKRESSSTLRIADTCYLEMKWRDGWWVEMNIICFNLKNPFCYLPYINTYICEYTYIYPSMLPALSPHP